MCWEALGVIYPKPGFFVLFSLIFCLLSLAKEGQEIWPSGMLRFLFFIAPFLLFMGWGENGRFLWFFSLKSLCASFYWVCMHEHLCSTSTVYVCIYAQWMHMTQALGSGRLTPAASHPHKSTSDKGASAPLLKPSWADFPASLGNTF